MCKKQISILLSLVMLCVFTGGCRQSEFDRLADSFQQPDDSVRLRLFWYWMSDNVSQEGIERDLEAIKAAGIGSLFIGNIGGEQVPYGKVKLMSDDWWAALHTAMKKAAELDIEVGMFNSPGWSQSGGPWIKPQQSMRRIVSTSAQIEGGKHVSLKLASPDKDAQDVRVIAYPTVSQSEITEKTVKINKEQGKPLTVDFHFERPLTLHSFIYSTQERLWTDAELFVKEGSEYRSIKKIHINRSNSSNRVGFMRHAPVVEAIPGLQASDFRVLFSENGAGEAELTLSSMPYIERYPEKTLGKMFQDILPSWSSYMWDVQPEAKKDMYIPVERVIDLTDKMLADGTIVWDAPEGRWTIARVAMVTTGVTNAPASPEGEGLEVDKMNSRHVESHFDAFIGEVLRRIPAKDRPTFRIVVADSYETGGQNWTDNMLERFTETYGYSPVPYFPVFDGHVVGSRDLSDRFLWDLRRLVADMISYGYVGGLKKIANEHGLTLWLENYGHWGYPGEFLQYGGQSDEIGGEFWTNGSLGGIENRAASSSAHIYGKRKVWSESCTSGGPHFWQYPASLKRRIDGSFIEGINATLLSTYQHQPYEDWNPGINSWFGMEFNRKNTWFGKINGLTDYLRSCNLMLQQGNYVADVAYFIGEDAPKMAGITSPELPQGYSYDFINAEVLMTRTSIKNGKLTLPDGMQYSVLALPP
ncbi:MAG: glycoside hydrolase family 2, partial [Tannerella sp.]|nr:glycoside hydrolase family 2 [Tannerella sp.]